MMSLPLVLLVTHIVKPYKEFADIFYLLAHNNFDKLVSNHSSNKKWKGHWFFVSGGWLVTNAKRGLVFEVLVEFVEVGECTTLFRSA